MVPSEAAALLATQKGKRKDSLVPLTWKPSVGPLCAASALQPPHHPAHSVNGESFHGLRRLRLRVPYLVVGPAALPGTQIEMFSGPCSLLPGNGGNAGGAAAAETATTAPAQVLERTADVDAEASEAPGHTDAAAAHAEEEGGEEGDADAAAAACADGSCRTCTDDWGDEEPTELEQRMPFRSDASPSSSLAIPRTVEQLLESPQSSIGAGGAALVVVCWGCPPTKRRS